MNELVREIEEDIRRERMDKLWGKVSRLMLGSAAVVVLATIAIVATRHYREQNAMEHTSKFSQGIEQLAAHDYAKAISTFSELSSDESSPYYPLAMLRKAQAQENSGDHAGAMKTYDALTKLNGPFAELAKMMTPEGKGLESISKSSPFYFSQSELRAWQMLDQGKKDEAITQLLSLRDNPETPPSMRARLTAALEHLAPGKAPAPVKETVHD